MKNLKLSILLILLSIFSGCISNEEEFDYTDDTLLEPLEGDAAADAAFAQALQDDKADAALSYNAVARIAHAAGVSCTGERIALAVAVARAESAHKPDARLVNPGNGTDRGLWQINSKYHPNVSDACAYSPSCNARAMARISNGGRKWSPWWSWKNGKHRPFMAKARAAQSAICGG